MKSISLLASLAAASVICIAAGCSSSSDNNNTGGTGGTGGSGNGTAGSGNGGKSGTAGSKNGAAGESTGEAGDNGTGATTGQAGDTGNGEGGDMGMTGSNTCSTGTLLAGDPLWDGANTGQKPAGQGLLDDPPLMGEQVVMIGNMLFIENEEEIWSADLSAKTPVLSRFAGTRGSGFINAGTTCAASTFLVIRDMAATADGKLVVIDYVGGAVVEITNPGAANCTTAYVAGTHAKTADPGQDYPLGQGDMDGPGATALFGGVGTGGGGIHKVTVDPDGNIYTYDDGTGKFKMIATDKDRTVTTIGQGTKSDNINGLAYLGGKIYATGVDGTNDLLEVVDPSKYKAATPKDSVTELFRNRGDQFPEVTGTGHQAITTQLIADGDGLIVSSQFGYVWRLDTKGNVLGTLFGTGITLDFPSDFDLTKSHPAAEWPLAYSISNSNGGPWIFKSGSTLLWSGGNSVGKYVIKFSCP